jgi:antitoxin YefM
MRATTVTDFRANIATMLDHVTNDHVPLFVTRNGGRNVVVVSADDWAGMQETVYLLSSPANAERLLEAVAELKAGKGIAHDLIED